MRSIRRSTTATTSCGSSRRPPRRGAATGAFGGVDPRALSLGAITLAAVLAVPLFHAITQSGGDASNDALRVVAAASTTTVPATIAPTTVIAVSADMSTPVATRTPTIAGARAGGSTYSADASGAQSSNTAAPAQVATTAPPPPPCTNEYSFVAGDYWLRIADAVDVCARPAAHPEPGDGADAAVPGIRRVPAARCRRTGPADHPARHHRAAGHHGPGDDRAAGHHGASDDRSADDGRPDHRPADHRAADDRAGDHAGRPTPPTTLAVAASRFRRTRHRAGVEVEQMIRDIWPDDLEDQALRIAWRESNYRPDVTSGTGCCVGVFQLHWESHQGWMADLGITSRSQLFDARTNIEAAYALYQRSGGWGPWT